jgi:hypothetical protein
MSTPGYRSGRSDGSSQKTGPCHNSQWSSPCHKVKWKYLKQNFQERNSDLWLQVLYMPLNGRYQNHTELLPSADAGPAETSYGAQQHGQDIFVRHSPELGKLCCFVVETCSFRKHNFGNQRRAQCRQHARFHLIAVWASWGFQMKIARIVVISFMLLAAAITVGDDERLVSPTIIRAADCCPPPCPPICPPDQTQ